MNENKLTPEQQQALMKYASKKLGMTPEQLSKTINTNDVQSLTSNLPSSDAAKFQAVVSDKKKLQQMLGSPQAQQLIEKLLGSK